MIERLMLQVLRFVRNALIFGMRCCLHLRHSNNKFVRRLIFDAGLPGELFLINAPYICVGMTWDRVITRSVYVNGEFEIDKIKTAFAILAREGYQVERFVDVGANIGTAVLQVMNGGMARSAVAIEPHPLNARLLRANLALNGFANVSVFECAVGMDSGVLTMTESGSNGGDHRIGAGELSVRCERLDDVLSPVDGTFIWMDVQGYEGHALQGAPRLLASGCPVVAEFMPEDMEKSGGYEVFIRLTEGRKIYDLNCGLEVESLDQLGQQLKRDGTYTDVLIF